MIRGPPSSLPGGQAGRHSYLSPCFCAPEPLFRFSRVQRSGCTRCRPLSPLPRFPGHPQLFPLPYKCQSAPSSPAQRFWHCGPVSTLQPRPSTMKLFSCLTALLLFLLQAVPGKGQDPRGVCLCRRYSWLVWWCRTFPSAPFVRAVLSSSV